MTLVPKHRSLLAKFGTARHHTVARREERLSELRQVAQRVHRLRTELSRVEARPHVEGQGPE